MRENRRSTDKMSKVIDRVESAVRRKISDHSDDQSMTFDDNNESTVIVKGEANRGETEQNNRSSVSVIIISLILLAILSVLIFVMLRSV